MFKTILSFLVISFIFVINSNAQHWQFGVRANLAYNDVIEVSDITAPSFDYVYYSEPRILGGLFGIAKRTLSNHFGLDLALGLSIKGGKLIAIESKKYGTLYYAQFSPSLWFKPFKKKNILLLAGLNTGYLAQAEIVSTDPVNHFDLAWTGSIEYRFQNIGIHVKYSKSTTAFVVEDFSALRFPKFSYFNQAFSLGGTFYFWNGAVGAE